MSLTFRLFFSVDGGPLETGCVAVEGAANVISREDAAHIFNRTEVSNQSIVVVYLKRECRVYF